MRFQCGDVVQHFKREMLSDDEKKTNQYLYRIIGFAQHTETKEEMVVYEALYGDFTLYVRPMTMFESEVDHQKYPDVKQQYRFEKYMFT